MFGFYKIMIHFVLLCQVYPMKIHRNQKPAKIWKSL